MNELIVLAKGEEQYDIILGIQSSINSHEPPALLADYQLSQHLANSDTSLLWTFIAYEAVICISKYKTIT